MVAAQHERDNTKYPLRRLEEHVSELSADAAERLASAYLVGDKDGFYRTIEEESELTHEELEQYLAQFDTNTADSEFPLLELIYKKTDEDTRNSMERIIHEKLEPAEESIVTL